MNSNGDRDLGHRTLKYVKVKITKGGGTNISATEDVGPVNLLLPSLFSQVDVTLQGKTVVYDEPLQGIHSKFAEVRPRSKGDLFEYSAMGTRRRRRDGRE